MTPTPISKLLVDGREFLIKRDDLYDPYLSGNKFRKLQKLIDTPQTRYKRVISYGGTQSNAMLSIAALAKQKGWEFIYYTKPLSSFLKENPSGNYKYALSFGMQHIEVEHELYRDMIASLRVTQDGGTVLVDQGGADVMAAYGLEKLANELHEQLQGTKFTALATPSGTGTTALFLAKAMPEYKVFTTPSVGDKAYLMQQMQALSPIPSNLHILETSKKYHFAKPYREFYELYKKLLDGSGIEFDLLYAPLLWQELLQQRDEDICYIHSGGLLGNESMLARYRKLLDKKQ
jgi:1-aminocyclopropane-1-carboxylate deaminase/D-cysteine desulfhydrase-like pyridoxal-dependent ACC family enzyme